MARRWCLFVATAAATAAPCLPVQADDVRRAAAAGLCGPGEAVYFTCSTAGGKLLSLCGQGRNVAALQYRFGRPGRIELAHPPQAGDGASTFLYAEMHRYQADRTEVRFDVAGTGYTVFDGTEAGTRRAGVSVLLPGAQVERTAACRGPVQARLGQLKPFLRCDADSALNSGQCP